MVKELSIREQRNESELFQRQLQLKIKENEAYLKEIANQKNENAKLREKLKEMMTRNKNL